MKKLGKSVLSSKPQYRGKSTTTIAQMRKDIIKEFVKSSLPKEAIKLHSEDGFWAKVTCYTKPKGYKIKVDHYFIDETTKYGKTVRKEAQSLMRYLHDLGIPFSTKTRIKTFDQPYRVGDTITTDMKTMSIIFFLTYSQIDGMGELL